MSDWLRRDPRLFALPGLMNKTAVTVPMRLKSDDELLENIDDGPWFSPSLDRIQIPDQGRFVVTPGGGSPEEAFESVFLHECGHATATIPGCERDLSRAWYGGPIYAQEEVVAELTSQLVMRRLGKLSKVSPASVTYLLGWLSATFDEADARTYAEHEARKAADYLCGLYFSVITTDRREV